MSRLRRPMGRLRDTPIWAKLGLIMIVPTIATVIVGTNGLVTHIRTQSEAERARDLATLSQAAGDLVHNLQNENATAVMLLATPPSDQHKQAYAAAQEAVEEAKRPYSQQRNTINGVPDTFDRLLGEIDKGLADVPGWRSKVQNDDFTLSETIRAYQALIDGLIAIRDSATQLAGDNVLGERERVAAEVARIKDFMAQRRVVILEMFSRDAFEPSQRTNYIRTQTGEDQAEADFAAVANQSERDLFQQVVSGPNLRQSDKWQSVLNGKSDRDITDLPFNETEWDTALKEHADLVRKVEVQLDEDIVAQATELRDEVQRQVLIETGLLLGMLLLAILFAWLVARSMARSLRELRHGALAVAQFGLPQAVARLRDPSLSAQMSPAQVAVQIAEPLPVRSKDEFGQVTEAFNAVHLEAVRTAAEQAALRSSVSTMFVNLARRSQILVDRLIGHLDRLERGEEDPDRLAELFQLDHLATRMRRNDENLLVLAGADSTRVQREPAALIDVLRAAQSEVEHYTRIEFGVVDRDIEVASHAVNDLVHLVAELFDNATAFSPPDSHVVVEARRVGDRAVLYVEDRGIGITPDQLSELNERLATPPQVDVAVSRMMGLVVVARLAARHGVKVELRPATERGTIADVTMPPAVLVPRALSGRLGPSAQGAQPTPLPTPAPPPPHVPARPFAPPLALESGPSGRDPYSTPSLPSRPFEPAPPLNGGGLLGANRGGMPAWSDLTGATAAIAPNGNDTFSPRTPNGQRSEPLPQRRGADHWPGENGAGPVPPGATIPRQPGSPEGHSPFAPPPLNQAPPPLPTPPVVSAPPAAPAPPARPGPAAIPSGPTPPVAPPPAWPPIVPDRETNPPVPERLAAALDMTAEIPRVRPDGPPSSPEMPAAAPATSSAPTRPPSRPVPASADPGRRLVDETMELPIFRELESAWFRTRRSASDDSVGSPVSPGASESRLATVDAVRQPAPTATNRTETKPASTGPMRGSDQPVGNGVPAPAARPPEPPAWQTAADEGWKAAMAASDVSVTETTTAGLPKRTPMAQLVPGGVDKGANAVQRRTPEGVRGLLSAYHRGVQRGRSQPKDDSQTGTQPTPAGQQSAQAGKEHEA